MPAATPDHGNAGLVFPRKGGPNQDGPVPEILGRRYGGRARALVERRAPCPEDIGWAKTFVALPMQKKRRRA